MKKTILLVEDKYKIIAVDPITKRPLTSLEPSNQLSRVAGYETFREYSDGLMWSKSIYTIQGLIDILRKAKYSVKVILQNGR